MQDLNSENIDPDVLCNLALETCANAATAQFQNIDLVIRSLAYFLESIEIEPSNYRAHLGLGILLTGIQCYEDALNFLQNANDLKPMDEIKLYIELAEEGFKTQKALKLENALGNKKETVSDLINMSNKFKKV